MIEEDIDIEKLLELIVAVSEGFADTETIGKVKSLAGKLKENPDYNQVKALEYAVRTGFGEIYEKCKTGNIKYSFENPIKIDNISISYSEDFRDHIPIDIRTDKIPILTATIENDAWQYLNSYLNVKVISNNFNAKEFTKQILKMKVDEGILPDYSEIDLEMIKKYFPLNKKIENVSENFKEILNAIYLIGEELADTKARDNLKSVMEKIKINPDYNEIKALEHAVLAVFDKIYAKCPVPKTDSAENSASSKQKSKIFKFFW